MKVNQLILKKFANEDTRKEFHKAIQYKTQCVEGKLAIPFKYVENLRLGIVRSKKFYYKGQFWVEFNVAYTKYLNKMGYCA